MLWLLRYLPASLSLVMWVMWGGDRPWLRLLRSLKFPSKRWYIKKVLCFFFPLNWLADISIKSAGMIKRLSTPYSTQFSRLTTRSFTFINKSFIMTTRTLRKRTAAAAAAPATKTPSKRRKMKVTKEEEVEVSEELPHNLGSVRPTNSNVETDPASASASPKNGDRVKEEPKVKNEETGQEPDLEAFQHTNVEENDDTTRRSLRPRRSVAKSSYWESDNDLDDAKPQTKSRSRKASIKPEIKDEDVKMPAKAPANNPGKKTKANPYGLTPGITPFPDWVEPSAADCEEVYRRLAKVHGESKAPKKIPAPSLEVSGCGEVPSVLDALIRTRLSANTSNRNSSAAFRGLVDKFGTVKEGIGKGSVDWNKVRTASLSTLVEAIKTGGLAQVKGRDIKAILDMVYEENKSRKDAFLGEKKTGKSAGVLGSEGKTQGQKDLEILKAEQNVLSLDHIHGMEPDQAMQELIRFPGIGVKTSSCVILFCLQQPSFAVDTHVHRLSGWLKWIPPKASRDEAFSHLEVRIPNYLKYGLHKLFVTHGRTCIRCRANTSEGTEEWKKAECPLQELVERTGKRKGLATSKRKGKDEDDFSD